MAMYIRLMG